MRFVVFIKANAQTENGVLPSQKELADMGNYNQALVNAGIMLAGEGLQRSAKGSRVALSADGARVVDGPFAEAKELIAGFWIWEVASKEEAIAWAKRCPLPDIGAVEIELRPIFEADDLGEAFTPELREQEERIYSQIRERDS